MKIEDLSASLAGHRLTEELSPDQVGFLAACTKNARFGAGEILFREGDEATTCYVLRRGRVALETHVPGQGRVVFETVEEGDLVGLSWMFPPSRLQADARATEEVLAFAIDGACLQRKMAADHELGYAIYRIVLRRLFKRLGRARLQRLDVFRTT